MKPWQGRGWALAPRDRGPGAGMHCWKGHLVACERAKPGVALSGPAAETHAQRREGESLEISEPGDEGKRRHECCADQDEQSCRDPCAASCERATDELQCAGCSEDPSCTCARSLLRIGEGDPGGDRYRSGEERSHEAPTPSGERCS